MAGTSLATKYSSLPEADHRRRPQAHGDDLVQVFGGDNGEREHSHKLAHRRAHGVFEAGRRPPRAISVQVFFHQVGDHFRVGFGGELVAFRLELLLQLQVILNDPVVNHRHGLMAIAMRVGVLLRGRAVRGPARVPDAVRAVHGIEANLLFQISQLAGGPANVQLAIVHDGQARRVVPAVLQPLQAFQQHGHYTFVSDVTDNSRHKLLPRADEQRMVPPSTLIAANQQRDE